MDNAMGPLLLVFQPQHHNHLVVLGMASVIAVKCDRSGIESIIIILRSIILYKPGISFIRWSAYPTNVGLMVGLTKGALLPFKDLMPVLSRHGLLPGRPCGDHQEHPALL